VHLETGKGLVIFCNIVYKKEKVNNGKIIRNLIYGTHGFSALFTTDHCRQLTELVQIHSSHYQFFYYHLIYACSITSFHIL